MKHPKAPVPCSDADCCDQNTEPKPEVGMGATMAVGSDQYAATIIAVERNGRVVYAMKDWIIEDRTRDHSEYDPRDCEKFTLRGDTSYRKVNSRYGRLYIGERNDYRDPSY